MQTKLLSVVYVVFAAVLLLAPVSVATAALQTEVLSPESTSAHSSSQEYGNAVASAAPEAKAPSGVQSDLFQCLATGTGLPPINEVQTCMVEKGHSEQETMGAIKSQSDQELFAPYTGYESRGN
jgi:hypothetical protein